MTDWKPKDAKEVLDDIIGTAINNNSTCYVNPMNESCGEDYLSEEDMDQAIKDAVINIMESKHLTITFKSCKTCRETINDPFCSYHGEVTENNSCENWKPIREEQ